MRADSESLALFFARVRTRPLLQPFAKAQVQGYRTWLLEQNLGPVHTTLAGVDGRQFFSYRGMRSDRYRVYLSDDGRRDGENWPRPLYVALRGVRINSRFGGQAARP